MLVTKTYLKLLQPIYFATDQRVPEPDSFPVLDEIANILQKNKNIEQIQIDGHCDERATDRYNLQLSKNRAEFVKEYLISKGISKKRLQTKGFGRSQPAAHNSSETGMALNRRVEFTILKQKD